MERELEELAVLAARALVAAMGSDDWEARGQRCFADYFEQTGTAGGSTGSLVVSRNEMRAPATNLERVVGSWWRCFRGALERNPGSAVELRRLVREFGPAGLAEQPAPSGHVMSGGTFSAPVVQADHIGTITPHDGSTDTSTITGDHINLSRGDFNGPVIGVQNNYGARLDQPRAIADTWPRVDQTRPIGLSVYVRRDCDDELDGLVSDAVASGGLVLVTGEPLSGKTTTAWSALQRNAGDGGRVYAPAPGADLRDLPGQLRERGEDFCALWLDDLAEHLGERGLTERLLTQLVHMHVLVLATMRDDAYDNHRFGAKLSSRVLAMSEKVELGSKWSKAEVKRLAEHAGDRRLSDAAGRRGDQRVTEFLAVGPELWDEWRRARRATAHPRGHVLVRVAVDLARCGLRRGLAPESLDALCFQYDAFALDSESLDSALAWATRKRRGVTGLLTPGERPGTWRAHGALVAEATRSPEMRSIPAAVWDRAFACLRSGVESLMVEAAAHSYYLPLARAGNCAAMYNLSFLRRRHGVEGEAEEWLRRASESGYTPAMLRLGRLLVEKGDPLAAEPYLERCAQAGNGEAAHQLALLLGSRAVELLRVAASKGHPPVVETLADDLSSLLAMSDQKPLRKRDEGSRFLD
ncbi:sel1 repeat family protein [Streptomyces sp. NPDC050844]|uniref:tetratricopeptide repeat protein n=1 Tax=Streptomyces sp. NPDC050844 TaxID=3155790 RepID=UPI0033EAC29F